MSITLGILPDSFNGKRIAADRQSAAILRAFMIPVDFSLNASPNQLSDSRQSVLSSVECHIAPANHCHRTDGQQQERKDDHAPFRKRGYVFVR